ncbi:MAG: phosphate ABC transporter permease subunit PstC [Eubacteriales bacterium]|nr:phosphate ABC transporter permease subunit PstC [Eubacteriales bacterium]
MEEKLERKATRRRRTPAEFIMENLFLLCALASIAAVAVITVYLFVSGTPAIFKIGAKEFLLGTVWKPTEGQFGILPMIICSVVSTVLAVGAGGVIGVMTAVFMAELAPPWLTRLLRPCVRLLAGIPSVVYGYFGLTLIVPLIAKLSGFAGNSLLAVIVLLAMMILPTIISISEDALRAVPRAYKEGSLALGASHSQTIFKVLLPAARSGILSALVLGVGRAIGETMAVILVAGNTPQIPTSLFDSVRTLTINIAFEMSYAEGLHREALFATGVVLFLFIMALNILLNVLTRRREKKNA